jgi:hypothetical protein
MRHAAELRWRCIFLPRGPKRSPRVRCRCPNTTRFYCKGTTDSVVCFPFILPTFFSPEAYLIRYLTFRRKCKLPDLKEWQDQRSILHWGLANGESVVLDLCFRNPLLLKRREEISSAHSYPRTLKAKTRFIHLYKLKHTLAKRNTQFHINYFVTSDQACIFLACKLLHPKNKL